MGDIIKGNTIKESFGGKLTKDLLETKKYILVNATSKVVGGPFTRFDPANNDRKSCIDLVLISKELFKYVHKLFIDKNLTFTPGRPISKNKIRYTDHRSLILEFRNLPLQLKSNIVGAKVTMWNTNKIGGWEVYKMLTENNQKLEDAIQQSDDPTEAMKILDDAMNEAKYRSFGKVKVRNSVKGNKEIMDLQKRKVDAVEKADTPADELEELERKIAENLLVEQRKNLEKEFNNLKDLKSRKGKSASIFELRNKVVGKKKMEQEATVGRNPNDNKKVTEPNEIQEVSLA